MTSYFYAGDVTVYNSNHKIFLHFFDLDLCLIPTLKKVPPPMPSSQVRRQDFAAGGRKTTRGAHF